MMSSRARALGAFGIAACFIAGRRVDAANLRVTDTQGTIVEISDARIDYDTISKMSLSPGPGNRDEDFDGVRIRQGADVLSLKWSDLKVLNIRGDVDDAGQLIAEIVLRSGVKRQVTLAEAGKKGLFGSVGWGEFSAQLSDIQTIEPLPSVAPIALSPGVVPKRTRGPDPSYPIVSRIQGNKGAVDLEVTIGVTGKVTAVRFIQRTAFPDLDAAALGAVKYWEFEPTLRNGSPVPVLATVSVTFPSK